MSKTAECRNIPGQNWFVEIAFELAMSFIGVDFESIASRIPELVVLAHDFMDSVVGVPVNLGKHTKFGRGLKARDELKGARAFVKNALL